MNHEWKSELLLEAGLSGLNERSEKHKEFLSAFAHFKSPPGKAPKSYRPQIEVEDVDEKKVALTLDDRTGVRLRKHFSHFKKHHDELRFHLYAILMVSTWGSFETYLYGLFEELYQIQPKLLISNETCTFKEIVSHFDSPVTLLINKQLRKIGRFSASDALEYLKTKLKYQPSANSVRKLEDLYLIRNILAHNSGVVSPPSATKLAKEIAVVDSTLRISKNNLRTSIKTIRSAVTAIERLVDRKFFQKNAKQRP